MSQQELLIKVVRVMNETRIPYMATGSVVSSLQGEPRSTHDIDLVVVLPEAAVQPLLLSFTAPDYYLSEAAVKEALRTKGMFNLIEVRTGDKVDFWMLTDEPFDLSRFERRMTEEVFGIHLSVSRPEDTILAKLRWAKLSGGSEKQFTDALRVYEVQYEKLDREYLVEWSKRLGVEALWRRILGTAEVL